MHFLKDIGVTTFYDLRFAGKELSEIKIGIIGYGLVAKILIDFLKIFNSQILVYYPSNTIKDKEITQMKMNDMLKISDVVVLLPRVNKETLKIMNSERFALMKKEAYFINTARGPLVDYKALYKVLKEKKIRGAFLDTYETEPPPKDSPLLRLENVIVTPHIAGSSIKTVHRAVKTISEEMVRFIKQEPLKFQVIK